MSEQEMMERYIYEVTRRVSQEMREEIRMELGALIEDMRSGEGLSIEAVLEKLGDPAVFASRYREDNNYLIGPEYYDDYVWILKIVLIGIGVSAVVSAFVNGIVGMEGMEIFGWVDLFVRFFTELFVAAISGGLGAVGMITAIFAFLEWRKVKVAVKPRKAWNVEALTGNGGTEKAWTPFSLPAIPDKRALIKRSDSVVSVIFISIFAALLLFAPELFGAFRYENGRLQSIACVFNLEKWGTLLPIFLICLAVGLVDEIIRLVAGRYCKAVMYSSVICNVIQVAGAALLLLVHPLWNPEFAEQIRKIANVEKFSEGDMLFYWNTEGLSRLIFLFILLLSLVEVGIAVYKTLKYKS